ncbi:MAG: hypothetical protein MUF06_17695 [Pirellulaceae bacterium]|jgi:hypothetical protein|nr:hypothetical protein [Pirellulaceae bacterium]
MLPEPWQWITAALVVLAVIGVGIGVSLWGRPRRSTLVKARKLFQLRREWLEARFFTKAAASGKPRGLEWVDCEFEDSVSFARDRHTGQLRALVGVTIKFRAVEGGGMEDNPNVDNLRAASAVFLFDGEEWTSDGRVIQNLNPVQAIEHFRQELEMIE